MEFSPAEQLFENSIRLSPNPASEVVTVTIENPYSSGSIRVFDLQGKTVMHQDLEENTMQYQLQVSELRPGHYFILTVLDGRNYTERLIIE